jgi:E3 ubiquitin-protein ligase DOA10
MELVPSNSSKTHIQYEEEEESVCRICLLDMSQKEISEESSGICECREKGKHVHEDCLKEWLRIWVI